jgi:hypothetical protein
MHTGSCLCRAVRFEVHGDLEAIQLCHCADCRKAQGSAFGANMPVAAENFRLIAGQDSLRAYQHTPGKERVFCGTCGSPLFSRLLAKPDRVRVRAGTLDAPTGATLAFHFYTDSKADWCDLPEDGLPRYPAERPI